VTEVRNTDRLCGLVVRVPGYRSRGPGFDSRHCHIFWEVVGLERGPLSLVTIIEELLEWKSSGSCQEIRIKGQGDPLRWQRDTLYPQKFALTSPTSGCSSVGIFRLRTKGHEVFLSNEDYRLAYPETARTTVRRAVMRPKHGALFEQNKSRTWKP
jgi:hypothetical protein